MPGVTPSPWGAAAHSGIGAIWPWLDSGEPMFDDEALAMLKSEAGPRPTSPSSGYMPGDALPLWLLYMYGASAYTGPFSYPIVVAYSCEARG
jgi:hypothetical protein